MQPIIPKVSTFSGLIMGRVYCIEDDDGLTLIDASLAPSANRVLKQLQVAGHAPSAVKRILITHAHPDHIGGLPKLHAATGAQVYATALEKPVIEGEIPPRRPDPSQLSALGRLALHLPNSVSEKVPVSRVLEDQQVLPEVLGGLQVIFTPGHAPGHIAFWHPEHRLLFCGDVLFHLRKVALPIRLFTVDMATNIQSVQRIAELDPAIVCFGHGKPLTENTAQIIRDFAASVSKGA